MKLDKNKKIVGTLVPISALSSSTLKENDQGTLAIGTPFLNWLKKTGQSAWQILPINETQLETGSSKIHVPSPYKGYGVGLAPKYLSSEFAKLIPTTHELSEFINLSDEWIDDYAFFIALSDYFKTDDWREWEIQIRNRNEIYLKKFRVKLSKQINHQVLLQWQLHMEYKALKDTAKKMGIIMIGDLPYYISVKSPLVWVHQDIFRFESDNSMRFVSGIPDSSKAHFGKQIWGHPLYKWGGSSQNSKVLNLWKIRLRYLSKLFEEIRFDHAKALFDFGEIDLSGQNLDRYVKGPGEEILKEIILFARELGLSVFAEDSGEKLKQLRESLSELKVPGIKILRFAYNEKKVEIVQDYASISKYPANTVAYITTHDTETLYGYLQNLMPSQKKVLASTAGVEYQTDDKLFAKLLRGAVINSPARIVIVPIQDWLLATERINIPGTEKEVKDGNWQYKLKIYIEELPLDF